MKNRTESLDHAVVRGCLSGSETAWRQFYSAFIGLMRSVVRKRTGLPRDEVEDITQSAFLALATRLRNYDFQQSLPRFVCLVTESVMLDDHRYRSAGKRIASHQLCRFEDEAHCGLPGNGREAPLQDEQMERAEQTAKLRTALEGLDSACREVLKLRYYEELSFAEMAYQLGDKENTVTVRTRRCLEKLRVRIRKFNRRGSQQ